MNAAPTGELDDVLSRLLAAQDTLTGTTGMTDKQVHDEALTLLLAGHETTAVALTWTWYLLSQYPEAEAKLHAELATVLDGRVPTDTDLPTSSIRARCLRRRCACIPRPG